MQPKERRKHMRVPLLLETCNWTPYEAMFEYHSEIANISNSGTFIKSDRLPKPGSLITVSFQLPSELGLIAIKSKVVRLRWTKTKGIDEVKGFGVEFIEIPANIAKILDAYVIYLRNKQIITVSKKIIQEFFGNKDPFKS